MDLCKALNIYCRDEQPNEKQEASDTRRTESENTEATMHLLDLFLDSEKVSSAKISDPDET